MSLLPVNHSAGGYYMENFEFYSPTCFVFGKDTENQAGKYVKRFGGSKVLIHYGGGSAVRSGLLDRIKKSLDAECISYAELGGVKPNPRSGLVYEGIDICKKQGIDFVLAVGGGSVIDSAKAIAAGALYDGDFWDYYQGKWIEEALPIGTVLTIAAAGSEGSGDSVVTKEEGKYKIVAGERRWRASKIAGLEKIPAIVRTLDSQNRLELSIIENAQREDLNAIELATAYAKLKTQFNLSVGDIAAKVGKSEASIQGTMRLLNLPDDVKKIMVKEKLTEGVMRPLANANEAMIKKVLPKIIEEGWTARKVERYLQDNRKKSSAALIKKHEFHKDEDALSNKFGVTVKISGRSLTFKCKNTADLKALIKSLL